MVKKSDLTFSYPEELVATKPSRPTRVMYWNGQPSEIDISQLLDLFTPGDVLILNDSKVVKRRVNSSNGLEILFLSEKPDERWSVLFPAKKFKIGEKIPMPGDIELTLLEKGLPQQVSASQKLDPQYFQKFGELALPPYIQKARGERKNRLEDALWYQTEWAKNEGSTAAPTASLHFTNKDLKALQKRGVGIGALTLHVGLGTFLPVHAENLEEHTMHAEWVEIPHATLNQIAKAKALGGRVWALGTTVARALESWSLGYFEPTDDGIKGSTDIFIKPGFDYKVVDVLMTNFHQPESTLLALVASFAGLENVHQAYQWAIAQKFRLFSYGDLSVWTRT